MEVINLIITAVSNKIELKLVKDWVGEKIGTNWDVFFFKANRLFMYYKTQRFFGLFYFFKQVKSIKTPNVPALTFPVWWQRWDPAC